MRLLGISIFVFVLFFTLSFSSESDEINIWLEQSHINKVIEFEKSLGNELEFLNMKVSLSKSIYPLVDNYKIEQPVIIQRSQTGFLPLSVEYFYSKEDSIIRYISYDWEREPFGNFFDKPKIWKEESKKLRKYNAEYDKIKSILVSKIGNPVSQDEKPVLVINRLDI
ncbi:MAG: hypothetical protein ACK5UE_01125 [Chitinophagales bacterium]|jgi:hypothetical protein|nr:hypothetical protein [Sphingobacteriales bacterium]